jgi:hypothetical protein
MVESSPSPLERRYLDGFDRIATQDLLIDRTILTLTVSGVTRTVGLREFLQLLDRQVNRDFTSFDLINGRILVTHPFATRHPTVLVWDEQTEPVLPDRITSPDSNVVEIDFTSFWQSGILTPKTLWHLTIT